MAVATPAMLPVPMVEARAVERAWNWVMPPPFFCLEGFKIEPSVVLNHSPMSNT